MSRGPRADVLRESFTTISRALRVFRTKGNLLQESTLVRPRLDVKLKEG